MNISEAVSSAITALKANKIRTFLTMLGIIIGVFSVVLLVSLVKGVQNYVTDTFNAIGSNLVYIMPGRVRINSDPASYFTDNKLEVKHVKMLTSSLGSSIQYISPTSTIGETVTYKGKKFYSSIFSGNYEYINTYNLEIAKGRNFDQSEDLASKKVAILGSNVTQKLFGDKDPVGERIKIGDKSFEVIGVQAPKHQDFDDSILVPFETGKNVLDMTNITFIGIKLMPNENIELDMKKMENVMASNLKKDDFTVLNQADLLESIQSILQILAFGLGAVAAISLIVGGIGIMNIMLVSVTERTREIGLRKALGATSFNIATQFILESVFLSLSGGFIGLFLGVLGSLIARRFLRTEVPLWAFLVSVGFSLAVGVIFGTYPAYKASKKDPIESLRYE